jgi:hypothetical protein
VVVHRQPPALEACSGERVLDDLDAGLISTIADEARCYLLELLGRLQVERFLD